MLQRNPRPPVVAASVAMRASRIRRHRTSISRGSALSDDAGGLLTSSSSARAPPSRTDRAQWRRGIRAPWSQWRGPCRACTDFPVLHRRPECTRRLRSDATGRCGRRRSARREAVCPASRARPASLHRAVNLAMRKKRAPRRRLLFCAGRRRSRSCFEDASIVGATANARPLCHGRNRAGRAVAVIALTLVPLVRASHRRFHIARRRLDVQ